MSKKKKKNITKFLDRYLPFVSSLILHHVFKLSFSIDVHESVHNDIIMKATNKMQLCRLIYYSLSALHVSGDVFAQHQEHLTVFIASGSIHQCRCRLVS